MARKPGSALLIASVVASLVLAGCGGSGSHTYVVTPSATAAGIYLTIVSPTALPPGLLEAMKPGMTVVDKSVGPRICSYSRVVKGMTGGYAHLDGTRLRVTISGSNPLTSAVCSGHRKVVASTPSGATGAKGPSAPVGVTSGNGPTGSVGPIETRGPTGAVGPTGMRGPSEPPLPWPRSIEPVALTAARLRGLSQLLGTPIYWAGARKGYRYQFRRAGFAGIFVRYLPHGALAGAIGPEFPIVATYPFKGAFDALTTAGDGKALSGPGGTIYFSLSKHRPSSRGTHVLMAFPGVNYEVELYDPHVGRPAALAASGRIRPVGS